MQETRVRILFVFDVCTLAYAHAPEWRRPIATAADRTSVTAAGRKSSLGNVSFSPVHEHCLLGHANPHTHTHTHSHRRRINTHTHTPHTYTPITARLQRRRKMRTLGGQPFAPTEPRTRACASYQALCASHPKCKRAGFVYVMDVVADVVADVLHFCARWW